MSDFDPFFRFDTTRLAVGLAAALIALALACWAGVATTQADRESRSDAVKACMSIEDEVSRSECIRGAS